MDEMDVVSSSLKQNEIGYTYIKKTDTVGLEYQVAGHSRVGVLTHKLGHVLKPVQKEPLGSREIEFYRKVYQCQQTSDIAIAKGSQGQDLNGLIHQSQIEEDVTDQCFKLLQQVLPTFYGVGVLVDELKSGEGEGDEALSKYLILDNIVWGFQTPSVVDLKIGAQTWDPNASESKVNAEKGKYVGTKTQLGVSVTGMHYFDLSTKSSIRCKDGFGKELTTESIYTVLKQFLNATYGFDKFIAQIILDKLQVVKKLFSLQRIFHFYSSSILISYDAEYLVNFFKMNNNTVNFNFESDKNMSASAELLRDKQDCWLRVWMIDFAHVHPNVDGSSLDSNYIFGLDNVIKIFTNITNGKSPI